MGGWVGGCVGLCVCATAPSFLSASLTTVCYRSISLLQYHLSSRLHFLSSDLVWHRRLIVLSSYLLILSITVFTVLNTYVQQINSDKIVQNSMCFTLETLIGSQAN